MSNCEPDKSKVTDRVHPECWVWTDHIFPCDAVRDLPLIWDGTASEEQPEHHSDLHSDLNNSNLYLEKIF